MNLLHGAVQRFFGMNLPEPAHVDDGKKQIPDLFLLSVSGRPGLDGFPDLGQFLVDLGQGIAHTAPVESHAGYPALNPLGSPQGRQMPRNAVQEKSAVASSSPPP